MVTPGGWSVVVDPRHTRLAMRPPNAPPGLPHPPVPGVRGTPGLYTNRHAVSYFTALLCGIPLSRGEDGAGGLSVWRHTGRV